MHDDHASPHVQHMMCGAALAGLHVRGGERMCCEATRRTRVCCTSGGCLFFAWTVGRWSDESLYSEQHVTFEDDRGAYDQKDAAGFIRINALRLRLLAARDQRRVEDIEKDEVPDKGLPRFD